MFCEFCVYDLIDCTSPIQELMPKYAQQSPQTYNIAELILTLKTHESIHFGLFGP